MITTDQIEVARTHARKMLRQLNIAVAEEEAERIEVADFGLGDLSAMGLQLLVYINTNRVCAKELVMFPGQVCPEHYHPSVFGEPGKEETFRCRWGEVYLYVPGKPATNPRAIVPSGYEKYFTAWHEVYLRPGQQHTLLPETRHWFQAGPEGAIVSEFSTKSRDEYDVFTDPRIVRETRIAA